MKNLDHFRNQYRRSWATLSGAALAGATLGYALSENITTASLTTIAFVAAVLLSNDIDAKCFKYDFKKKELLNAVKDIIVRTKVSELKISVAQHGVTPEMLSDQSNIAKSVEGISPEHNQRLYRKTLLESAANALNTPEELSEFKEFELKTYDNTDLGRAADIRKLIEKNPCLAKLLEKEMKKIAKGKPSWNVPNPYNTYYILGTALLER